MPPLDWEMAVPKIEISEPHVFHRGVLTTRVVLQDDTLRVHTHRDSIPAHNIYHKVVNEGLTEAEKTFPRPLLPSLLTSLFCLFIVAYVWVRLRKKGA